MKIKYTTEIKNNIIQVSVETSGFTNDETTAFYQLGDPTLTIEKSFNGFPVSIQNKKIKSLKIKVKFDGSNDIIKAAQAEALFKEDLQNELANIMTNLMEKYEEVSDELSVKTDTLNIEY